eukprot:471400-Hanusia_phi.AAC.4
MSARQDGKYHDKVPPGSIISIIKKHAVRDLESDVPHLRACACWIIGEYDRLPVLAKGGEKCDAL